MGPRVMIALTGVVRGSSPSAVTYERVWKVDSTISLGVGGKNGSVQLAHPISKVLRGEDTAKTFLLVDDENTVGPFRGAKLTSIRYRYRFGDRKGSQRFERSYRAFGRCDFASTTVS